MKHPFRAAIRTGSVVACILLTFGRPARADYVERMHYFVVQPDGDTLRCFITGDEYYRELHDSLGYTVVFDSRTKYYVYATLEDGILKPTALIAGRADPTATDLVPGLRTVRRKRSARKWRQESRICSPSKGKINCLVISIRFRDECMTKSYEEVYSMFCDTMPDAESVYNFYRNASYGQLSLYSHFYPEQAGDDPIASVVDTHNSGYYLEKKFDPEGYEESEEGIREWTLLSRAIEKVAPSIDPALVLDTDRDGFVDNVAFLLSGSGSYESDILWPHQWQFDSAVVAYPVIRGLKVATYSLCMEEDLDVSTIAHETFHTMGAPDLYRKSEYDDLTPVGEWDLMATNGTRFKQMDARMKEKHGKWQRIPTLDRYGVYTLRPLNGGDSTSTAYRIDSESESQHFVLEFRRRATRDDYEIPGTGLLVYRTDDRYTGNTGYDGETMFDEIFIFHPRKGSDRIDEAALSSPSRDSLTKFTDPAPTLTDGSLSDSIRIEHVMVSGDSLQFYYGPKYEKHLHANFTAKAVGPAAERTVQLTDETSSDGAITRRSWTIRGGIPASVEGVRHVKVYFRTPGKHKVTLVTGNIHGKTDTLVRTVTIP